MKAMIDNFDDRNDINLLEFKDGVFRFPKDTLRLINISHTDQPENVLRGIGGSIKIGFNLMNIPNADEPQPKRSLTELNSHGRDFHEFISVRVLFREPDFFAFFAKISLVTD
jgi:hypothetical protein